MEKRLGRYFTQFPTNTLACICKKKNWNVDRWASRWYEKKIFFMNGCIFQKTKLKNNIISKRQNSFCFPMSTKKFQMYTHLFESSFTGFLVLFSAFLMVIGLPLRYSRCATLHTTLLQHCPIVGVIIMMIQCPEENSGKKENKLIHHHQSIDSFKTSYFK
jgi:hypothetical protein